MPEAELRRTHTCDVAIVGAGMVGAACAAELAEAGLDVVVLDALARPGLGSTGRSLCSVRGQWSDELNVRLSWEGIGHLRDFEARFGVDVGYRPTGYLFLVPEHAWAAQLEAVELQRSLGVPVETLDLDAARAVTPFSPEGIAGATWGPADGQVDPVLATVTYLRHAERRGARVIADAPVRRIQATSGGGWTLGAGNVRVHAGLIVNAAGGWGGELAALAGLEVPVEHYRRSIFAAGPVEASYPMTVDLGTGAYLRSRDDRVLVGKINPEEKPGYSTEPDWHWFHNVWADATRRFPWLAETAVDASQCWAGTYELTPDLMPIFGRHPEASQWIDACGLSGRGIMQAPVFGRLVREEVVDEAVTSLDVSALRLERFRGSGPVTKPLVV